MGTSTNDAVIVWLANNRGVLSKVAEQIKPKCTPQFVSQVARGIRNSKDGKIERILKSYGAPI